MSSQKLNSLGRLLTIGSAALLIQIGSVAAANQRADTQEQVREVLSGTVAHTTPRAASGRHKPSASGADFQAFARGLLQGSSASRVAVTRQQAHRIAARSGKYPDIQAMVRRGLRGA
jgi:hypothetical protein